MIVGPSPLSAFWPADAQLKYRTMLKLGGVSGVIVLVFGGVRLVVFCLAVSVRVCVYLVWLLFGMCLSVWSLFVCSFCV